MEFFLPEISVPAAVPSDPEKVHPTVLEDTWFNVLLGNVYFSGISLAVPAWKGLRIN